MYILKGLESWRVSGDWKREEFVMRQNDLDGFGGDYEPEFEVADPLRFILENTETGEVVTEEAEYDYQISELLGDYKPYGYVADSIADHYYDLYIVIDKLSLEFLSYVESVECIRIKVGDNSAVDAVMCDTHSLGFSGADEFNTLFQGDSFLGIFACTLLQAVNMFKKGMIGDVFYLPSSDDYYKKGKPDYCVYKVTFSDLSAAKRFLAKTFTLYSSGIERELSKG